VTKPVTLLVVEDDEIASACVRRGFARHQPAYSIRFARDGVEALELLRSDDPEAVPHPYLILLDINMPRMNGIEFLGVIRDDPSLRDSIVFMLTTSDASRDVVAAYSHNVAGYLVKSRFGGSFVDLTELVDSYCRHVEFPPCDGRAAA
jgi:CheY-like chemotaxis protein